LTQDFSHAIQHLYQFQIREISILYGISQVSKRSWGFKADFFAAMANALTTECVFLDGATHQVSLVSLAYNQVVILANRGY
jgi:hypothetical protein